MQTQLLLTCYLQGIFKVPTLNVNRIDKDSESVARNTEKLASAVYLQVSTISQALIFVTRSSGWSCLERPGLLLMCAFVIAQLVSSYLLQATSTSVYQLVYGDITSCSAKKLLQIASGFQWYFDIKNAGAIL